MKIRNNAVAIWCNLKGYYDIIIFKNGHQKNKFLKDYKELYAKFLDSEIDFEDFTYYLDTMFEYFEVDTLEEYYSKDIKKDKNYFDYIVFDNEKLVITDFIEYGY